jgi:hypothetical protein
MSEILTAPDRGPPQTNWRDQAARLERECIELATALRDVLAGKPVRNADELIARFLK